MKVILKQDIKGVGKKDQIINANDGYARNYLFPKNLAVPADKGNLANLQSKQASIAVSEISNIANNENLYKFGKKLIEEYRKKYNIILSSRDIIKMYPDVTYHFFIDASIEERINRKYMQYNKEIPKEQIKEMIEKRDKLKEKSGYYRIYPQTKIIDVTNCNNVEESTKLVLENMKETVVNGI